MEPKDELIGEPMYARQIGAWPSVSEEELMEGASLVVHGRVVGVSESFWIEAANGTSRIHTDYYIQIYETLRGEPQEEVITVRLMGGSTKEMVLLTDLTDALEIGVEYLLFLAVPGGSELDTPGYYYYVLGPSGIYRRETPVGHSPFSQDLAREVIFGQVVLGARKFELSELRETLEEVNARVSPPTEYDFWRMSIDGILTNIENGVLLPDTELLESTRSDGPSRTATIVE